MSGIRDESINRNLERIGQEISKYTRPIYVQDEHKRPDHIGSLVLLNIKGQKYVVTAAHVMEHDNKTKLYTGSPQGMVRLIGDWQYTKAEKVDHSDDPFDIAFMKPSNKGSSNLAGCHFFMYDTCKEKDSTLVMAYGFPRSQQRRDPKLHKVKPYGFSITYHAKPRWAANNRKYGPRTHIAIPYERRRMRGSDNMIRMGPKPVGMSGGGLWGIFDYLDSPLIAPGNFAIGLLGIIIEYDSNKSLLIGTRLKNIVSQLTL